MDTELRNDFKNRCAGLGIYLDEKLLGSFEIYTDELLDYNKNVNLTAITDPAEIVLKHYIDSLAVLKYVKIEENAAAADIGCGAGFPGLPIKIIRKDIVLNCIDSLQKRLNFIETVSDKIGLENIACVHLRAEEAGKKSEYREKFDCVFARAVAKLNVLSEYCLPLVKPGGVFIAMKSGKAEEEIKDAENAVTVLGGAFADVKEYFLPGTDISRNIVVIEKISETPLRYPRSPKKIENKPL